MRAEEGFIVLLHTLRYGLSFVIQHVISYYCRYRLYHHHELDFTCENIQSLAW